MSSIYLEEGIQSYSPFKVPTIALSNVHACQAASSRVEEQIRQYQNIASSQAEASGFEHAASKNSDQPAKTVDLNKLIQGVSIYSDLSFEELNKRGVSFDPNKLPEDQPSKFEEDNRGGARIQCGGKVASIRIQKNKYNGTIISLYDKQEGNVQTLTVFRKNYQGWADHTYYRTSVGPIGFFLTNITPSQLESEYGVIVKQEGSKTLLKIPSAGIDKRFSASDNDIFFVGVQKWHAKDAPRVFIVNKSFGLLWADQVPVHNIRMIDLNDKERRVSHYLGDPKDSSSILGATNGDAPSYIYLDHLRELMWPPFRPTYRIKEAYKKLRGAKSE